MRDEREHFRGETLHLLALRAALQEQKVDPDLLEAANSLRDLVGGADKTGAQAPIRDAVVLERHLCLELRPLDEILVARVAARARTHVGYARDLLLHFSVAIPHDRVGRDTEPQRWQLRVLRATRAHVLDLDGERLRRIAVHQIGVTLVRDEIFRRGRLAARVEDRPWLLHGFRRESRVFDRVIAALERVLVFGPHSLENCQELFRTRVAFVVFYPRSTVLAALLLPPCAHDVQREAAVGDLIDGRGLLRDERGQPKVRPHRGHELEALGEGSERRSGGPGLEAVGLWSLYVVQVELGDERDVPSGAIRLLGELALVREGRGHALVLDVAQPSPKDGHPEPETHALRLAGPPPRRAERR